MFLFVDDNLFNYKDSQRNITKDLKNARKKFGHDNVKILSSRDTEMFDEYMEYLLNKKKKDEYKNEEEHY